MKNRTFENNKEMLYSSLEELMDLLNESVLDPDDDCIDDCEFDGIEDDMVRNIMEMYAEKRRHAKRRTQRSLYKKRDRLRCGQKVDESGDVSARSSKGTTPYEHCKREHRMMNNGEFGSTFSNRKRCEMCREVTPTEAQAAHDEALREKAQRDKARQEHNAELMRESEMLYSAAVHLALEEALEKAMPELVKAASAALNKHCLASVDEAIVRAELPCVVNGAFRPNCSIEELFEKISDIFDELDVEDAED